MNTGPRYSKAEFTALFSELGKLRTKCHPDAKTFCLYNPRKIPHPLIPKVKSQIETMLPQGVISPKRALTEWCNQSYGSSLSIKNCVANFPPSSANLLWREIRVEPCVASKGKTSRSSPLCSQQAVDPVSENDEEVEQILSQSLRPQLNPRTSLVSFIWSVFASNLPTISPR